MNLRSVREAGADFPSAGAWRFAAMFPILESLSILLDKPLN